MSSQLLSAAVTFPETSAPPPLKEDASLAVLRWLPVLCVLLPLIAYLAVGSYRYRQIRAEVDVRLDSEVQVTRGAASD